MKISFPRPWLVSSQFATLERGSEIAKTVNPAKIALARSHLGPSKTSVTGWESARSMLVKKKATKITASYIRIKVDRYLAGCDCNRDNAGRKTALIGRRNCSNGRMTRAAPRL